jgi:hypothetical protein
MMPIRIIIMVVVGTVAVVMVAHARRRGGLVATLLGLGGILALLIGVFFLRMSHSPPLEAARQAATLEAISAQEVAQRQLTYQLQQREAERLASASPIPDAALVEPAPRAPEPDDDVVARPAPSNFRTPGVQGQVTEAPLPDWAVQGGGRQIDGEYYAVVSAVGNNADDCWNRLLSIDIAQALYQYALREIGAPFPYPRVDREMVDMMLVDQHITPWRGGGVNMDGSPAMQQVFLRLHLTPAVRERLIDQRAEELVSSRIVYTIWTAILACGAVGIVFAYLKLDAASNGTHSTGLRIAAGTLLVGVAFGCVMLFAYFVHVESFGGIFAA